MGPGKGANAKEQEGSFTCASSDSTSPALGEVFSPTGPAECLMDAPAPFLNVAPKLSWPSRSLRRTFSSCAHLKCYTPRVQICEGICAILLSLVRSSRTPKLSWPSRSSCIMFSTSMRMIGHRFDGQSVWFCMQHGGTAGMSVLVLLCCAYLLRTCRTCCAAFWLYPAMVLLCAAAIGRWRECSVLRLAVRSLAIRALRRHMPRCSSKRKPGAYPALNVEESSRDSVAVV